MNRQAHARQLERPEVQLSENAKRVLNARYLRRDSAGNVIESPREMFERVARAVSQAELMFASSDISQYWEERFRALLCSLDFLPNSPTLMNAGTLLGQLSACFVLPIEDNLQSIFRALGDMAQIQRSGGGTGFSFSHLRAAGERLSSSGGTSSGPVSFMEIFDSATENIKLGGRRRGANMAVLRINHPDIEAFIDCKRDGSLRNFNLSIAITDEFMQSVDKGEMHSLRARDGREVKTVRARDLFNRICDAAWNSGDPGLLFIDTINRQNPVITDGAIESTNPCGEVPLLPYESCNLGSINLSHFVTSKQGRASIDFELLRATVHDSVRFLDDVITANRYPLAEVERATLESRKIGLGVMGFAEVCILLGIPYTSEYALQLAEQVMQFVSSEARHASMCLAMERDTFLAWPRSTFASTGLRLRNATLTSIAPTGTLSLIAGTSSGIEPLFGLCYRHVGVLGQQELFEFNSLFEHSLRSCADNAEEILNSVAHCGRMSDELPIAGSTRELFRTALEIAPEQHVRMQAAFQKHVDNAVSKTVNLPNEASLEQVSHVYRMAHRLGCKGVTVFRYGSKGEQVLELGSGEAGYEREYFTRCDPDACKLYKTGLQTHSASSEPTYIGQRLSAGHEGSADA